MSFSLSIRSTCNSQLNPSLPLPPLSLPPLSPHTASQLLGQPTIHQLLIGEETNTRSWLLTLLLTCTLVLHHPDEFFPPEWLVLKIRIVRIVLSLVRVCVDIMHTLGLKDLTGYWSTSLEPSELRLLRHYSMSSDAVLTHNGIKSSPSTPYTTTSTSTSTPVRHTQRMTVQVDKIPYYF